MKNTENIKAPEAFLIERGGQQTDHKAAHSRHSDGASKRTQGSLSLRSLTNIHYTRRGMSIPKGRLGVVLHREDVPSGRQVGGCADRVLPADPLAKRITEQMWRFWDLGKRPSETWP